MGLTRVVRTVIALGALALAAAAPAGAETYPDKPIRFVVGFGQGGPTDVAARALAEEIGALLGGKIYVENRPGASGNIATQAAATSPADGYTFLIGATPLAVNETLFPDFPIRFGKNIAAVGAVGATGNVLVAHPSLNVRTVADYVALARRQPGAVDYITLGRGSSSHLAGLEFERLAGVSLTPVPHLGNGEAVQDIVGGHVKSWFATIPSVVELVKGGQVVALGVTGPVRSASLPDVPTLSEAGLTGFDVRLWIGLFAPVGIPAERLRAFSDAFDRAIARPELQAVFAAQGIEKLKMTQPEFTAFVEADIARWSARLGK